MSVHVRRQPQPKMAVLLGKEFTHTAGHFCFAGAVAAHLNESEVLVGPT